MAGKRVKQVNDKATEPKSGSCVDCERGYVMSDGVKGNPLIIECPVNHTRYPQS